MKLARRLFFGALVLAASIAWGPTEVCAQGSLAPPGAPAPTMRALHEIETRTPVQSLSGDGSAQFVIAVPGAYYLTGDISGVSAKSAIAINADGVTLDLCGHILTGVTGALRGIEFRGVRTGFTIRNGVIRNFDGGGVSSNGGAVTNGRIAWLTVLSCSPGIAFGSGPADGVAVSECTVTGGTASGISLTTARGLVERCAVSGLSGSAAVIGIMAQAVNGCTVTNIAATGSAAAQGIACAEASQCAVSGVTNSGSGPASGIAGSMVTNCDVQSISSSAAAAIGIDARSAADCTVATISVSAGSSSCSGINSTAVHACRVTAIGTTAGAAGTPVGISATTVSGCTVTSVGNAASVGAPVGIAANNVQHCSVQTIGSSSSTVGATGVSTNSAGHIFVNGVSAGTSGDAFGISASEASHCYVQSVTLAGGSGSATGIAGEVIGDSRVNNVFAISSGASAGLSSYRICRNCSVSVVGNTGSGPAYGAFTFNAGRTENVTVQGSAIKVGISVESDQTVIGCTISQAITGIAATSTRNIIDGNNIGFSTTAISVLSGANTASALIVRNQIRNSTTKILSDAPCQVGPLVSATGAIASTSPWANFSD